MDKKSKIFFLVLFFLILISVAATYYRIVMKKDYLVEAQIECDPYAEKCFVWECDSESAVEGEACVGDPEADVWYYKIARRNASNVALCDPETDENCDPWTCDSDEKDCAEIFCDEENKIEQGVECNDPEKYTLENPIEEEEASACAEGDEECLAAEEAENTECAEGDEECLSEENYGEKETFESQGASE